MHYPTLSVYIFSEYISIYKSQKVDGKLKCPLSTEAPLKRFGFRRKSNGLQVGINCYDAGNPDAIFSQLPLNVSIILYQVFYFALAVASDGISQQNSAFIRLKTFVISRQGTINGEERAAPGIIIGILSGKHLHNREWQFPMAAAIMFQVFINVTSSQSPLW